MNYFNSSVLFLANSTPILIGIIIGVVCLLVAVIGSILWVKNYKTNISVYGEMGCITTL